MNLIGKEDQTMPESAEIELEYGHSICVGRAIPPTSRLETDAV